MQRQTYRENSTWWWKQRPERCVHKHGNTKDCWQHQKRNPWNRSSSRVSKKRMAPLTSWCQISSFQNHETIHFCCSKSPSSWYFVTHANLKNFMISHCPQKKTFPLAWNSSLCPHSSIPTKLTASQTQGLCWDINEIWIFPDNSSISIPSPTPWQIHSWALCFSSVYSVLFLSVPFTTHCNFLIISHILPQYESFRKAKPCLSCWQLNPSTQEEQEVFGWWMDKQINKRKRSACN